MLVVHMEEEDSWQEDQSILDEESSYDHWSEDCSTLILKRILMKEILSQYHQTLTTLITTPVIVLVEKLAQKRAMKMEEAGIESCLENQEEWEHESDEETQLQLDVKKNSWEAQTHPDSYQDIEDSSWAEVLFSGHEERQTKSMKPYRDFGSWYEETDSPITQYHHLQKNDTHAAYTHTSTPRFKKSKKANHPHSPQKVEPAKEKLTIKQARNSQPNSLKLPKGPEIRPRSKGDSEHTERKTTV
ncbi:hypothetical protein HID58_070417, partial [Brassica napus]